MDQDDWPHEQSSASSSASSSAAPVGAQAETRMPMSAAEIGGDGLDERLDERLDEQAEEQIGDHPTVGRQAWLKQDDYWQRTTYIAVTGRQSRLPRTTRALPRPRRFRKPTPLRSGLTLALTLALIVLIPMGVVMAQREAQTHIKLPTSIPNIPGLVEPTATHTPHPTATATIRPTATPRTHN